MRAVVQHEGASAEHLAGWREIGKPAVSDRTVLVRVHAAGLDRGTWHVMTGTPYPDPARARRPWAAQPGTGTRRRRYRGRGRVKVTRFAPGDEVYGVADGSFAEYAWPGRTSSLASRPA